MIFGENGSGKTSVLEAIYLLSMGKSFKTNRQKEMIQKGMNKAIINGSFFKNNIMNKIDILVDSKLKKRIKINGKEILKRNELLGCNNVVVLSPEEQKITKESTKQRRIFFDKLFSITSKSYIKTLQEYNKVLKQRNTVLKNTTDFIESENKIKPWDDIIIQKGLKLWKQRYTKLLTFKNLFKNVTNNYNSKLNLDFIFNENIINQKNYEEEMLRNRGKDILLNRTSFGPHLDQYTFFWNDKNLRNFGSQGEHKIFLVLLKLTELNFIKEKTGENPIFLFDDLFATLDIKRSKEIIKILNKSKENDYIQTIITTTDIYKLNSIGFDFDSEENNIYELKKDETYSKTT